MVAQAAGARKRQLSQDDLLCEECLSQYGMVEDLPALGVQIVKSDCAASPKQISNYLAKVGGMLDVTTSCEADMQLKLTPTGGRTTATRGQALGSCTGGNTALGTNDPLSSCQSNLETIRISSAWQRVASANRTPRQVILAIVDSGVDTTHPDLINQFWKNPVDGSIGYNFLDDNTDVTDLDGHGTHCAGIAGAQTNNDIGIAGIANVKLMILKFMGRNGTGLLSDALRAFNFAVQMGAAVSSHSYGAAGVSSIFGRAIANAAAQGHIFVTASGNDGVDLDDIPSVPCSLASSIPTMMCVGASESTNPGSSTGTAGIASFSNVGSAVNIVAPGVNIPSTYPNGRYAYLSGTSMATPHVAAVAAILASLNLDGERITQSIVQSRTTLQSSRRAGTSQLGELDALNAVLIGLGQPTSPPRSSASPIPCGLLVYIAVGLLATIMF
ncbi:Suppressor of the cold-sensitive snRNP bioproteinsis mutant brr1-1 [Perkinsus chesapeaki]|uniref:subtilisin n=1 Tax=Perkinsus chesapeaki TaxID=330153 RepID=A0A7J6N3A0_PERCH|nr:Suppressor of the cold-sensitive snRNP bioproteinsis mutant brr1-1 [Perkinsus chesapeaki]